MDLSKYISKHGVNLTDFAQSIGVSRDMVYQWVNHIRPIAGRHCPAIERVTEGKVTRPELRPNDWRELWPDLAIQKARRPSKRKLQAGPP